MSNAFCTARNPLALETATGFAAQRLRGGSGRGGRIGKGMSRAWAAATPTAAEARNSRRDSRSATDTLRLKDACVGCAVGRALSTCCSWTSQIRPASRVSPHAYSGCWRSEEHTSELQSHSDLVCRLLLEK